MKKRKKWNLEEFNKINLPEIIESNINREKFSKNNNIRVLDLPIYMEGQGWSIPDYLEQFKEVINIVFENEKKYELKDYYVYITVDQKIVKKGFTGRRAGAHSDAYIENANDEQVDVVYENSDIIKKEIGAVSHTYIIYDTLPTEFFNAKFPLIKSDCEHSLKTFNDIADNSEIIIYPNYSILKLDPYVVHRSSLSMNHEQRTFVKISFSKKRYSRKGNTINKEFDYNWDFKKREKDERNHPW